MEEPILKVSLKEYKKSIDDLRASLLNLDSASEEYKSTAEEIRDKQNKLNKVMSVGKKDVDAVAGSYNALSQEMSRLKKEWKNMEIGTDAWKEMAVHINDLNDKLKDADAQVGVFSRNVGDYANAFGVAFDKAAGEIGKINGPLGETFKTIKMLIPVIKSANSTAVKGLNGVKAALVSTGIGALIVAVGLLVTHWEDLMKLVRGTKDQVKKFNEENEKLSKTFDDQNFALEQQNKLLAAQGVENDELIKSKIELIKAQIKETTAQLEEIRATYKAIAAHSWLGRVLRGEQGDYKELKKMIEEQEKELDSMTQKLTGYETDLQVYYEQRKQKAKEAYQKEREEVERLIQTIEDNNKTELQKLEEKYNKELDLLKKHHKSTKALTEQYNKDVAALNKKADDERAAAVSTAYGRLSQYYPEFGLRYEMTEAQKELKKFADLTNKEFPPQGFIDMILAGEDANEVLTNLVGDSVKLLENAKKEGVIMTDSADEFVANWISAFERVNKARQDNVLFNGEYFNSLVLQYDEMWDKIAEGGDDKKIIELEFESNKIKKQIALFEAAYQDAVNKGLENSANLYKLKLNELKQQGDEIVEQIQNRESELKIRAADNTAAYGNLNEDVSGFWNTVNFDEGYKRRIEAAQVYLDEVKQMVYDSDEEKIAAEIAAQEELYNIQREYNQKKIENYQELAGAVGDIFGSIADIYQQDIENQKAKLIAQGKTEEEANKMLEDEFETSKKFQIAQATINTISGAITAFMKAQELGQPWGLIIGAANAAAVTAAGIAQIQKISSTTIGSTGSDIQSPQVTPRLAEYSPERTSNITSASDTDNLANALSKQPVYVKVSDIDRAQKKVEVRGAESRF